MPDSGIRWTVVDRDGYPIYLTEERWQHIIDPGNHPEVVSFEEHLKTTIRKGRRRQEPLNPRKYRYAYAFDDLPDGLSHIVAIVLFGYSTSENDSFIPNNFIATVFFKHIKS